MENLSLQPIQNCTLFYFVFYSTSGVLVFEMINLLSTLQKCFVIGALCKNVLSSERGVRTDRKHTFPYFQCTVLVA